MKSIVLGVIILLVIGVGGYYIYTNYMPGAPAEENTTGEEETVQIQEVTVGTGAEAVPGSIVSVLYVGRLEDGTVFDSSEAYNNEPLTFVLGTPDLLPGFQIGMNGMRVGGERIIAVPASLGYGEQGVLDAEGTVIVPPNATLIFNIGLVNVQATSTAPVETTAETE